MDDERNFPTMIIPAGTEISVNESGELAIRTPGNLIIQNPGSFSVIHCSNGSMRIDADVRVDAVTVDVADTCCVAGTLSAWQVKAKKLILEKGSQAFVILLQAESLELHPQARLVGNFSSEKELYLMLGRFTQQLRGLPTALKPGDAMPELAARSTPQLEQAKPAPEDPADSETPFGMPQRTFGS